MLINRDNCCIEGKQGVWRLWPYVPLAQRIQRIPLAFLFLPLEQLQRKKGREKEQKKIPVFLMLAGTHGHHKPHDLWVDTRWWEDSRNVRWVLYANLSLSFLFRISFYFLLFFIFVHRHQYHQRLAKTELVNLAKLTRLAGNTSFQIFWNTWLE